MFINLVNDDDLANWIITDYLSQLFGLKTTDILTCLSYHHSNSPNILEEEYFFISFEGI